MELAPIKYAALPQMREAVVIGAGPSLTPEAVSLVMRWRTRAASRYVVVVNTSYRMVPEADVLYAGDKAWFDAYAIDAARHFRGAVWTGCEAAVADWPAVRLVRRVNGDRLPKDGICVGGRMGNSGIQAIYFAALCGAWRIGLLGFDGGPRDGKTHWHDAHMAPLRPCYRAEDWPTMFDSAAAQLLDHGALVTNLTPDSRIKSFAAGRLEEWTS